MQAKYSVEQIRKEIAALERSGFRCAVYYLKVELRRRTKSTGKRPRFTDERHLKNRESARKYREKKTRETIQSIDKEAYNASIEQESAEESREIVPFEDL